MKLPSIFFHPDVLVVLADYIAIQIGCRENGETKCTKKEREFIADILNEVIQEVK